MFKKKNIHYIIISLLLLLNLSTYFYLNRVNQITAPDFIQNNFFSDVFAKTYSLETCKFNFWLDPIFWTRWLRITEDNCVSHWSMHGFIILLWLFKAISSNIQNLTIPLCLFIFLVYLYKISFFLFKKRKISILIVFLSFFFPNIFLHSNLLFNNIPETALFLWFLYYSLQYYKEQKMKYLIIWLTFLCISFRIRYIVIIFALPILLLYIKNIKYKTFIYWFFIATVFITPFFITNYRLFDNVLGSPKASLASVQYYNLNIAWVSWWIWMKYFFNGQIFTFFLKNLYNHFILLYPYIFLFLCLLIIDIWRRKTHINKSILGMLNVVVVVVVLVFVFYYIWVRWWFSDKNTLATSYARYTILWYSLLLIFIINYIVNKFHNKNVLQILMFLLALNFLTFSLKSTNWYFDVNRSYSSSIWKKEYFLTNTKPNWIIFTSYYDKLFFPERAWGIYTSYPEELRIKKTTEIILKLLKLWYPVYFVESDWWINYDKFKFKDYKDNFLKNNLITEAINPPIYEVKIKSNE
jgi:hypothetical protein